MEFIVERITVIQFGVDDRRSNRIIHEADILASLHLEKYHPQLSNNRRPQRCVDVRKALTKNI